MSKTFVILGGSFGAKTAAEWALENLPDYKVIMISLSDKFLAVPSTVRLVAQPEMISKAQFSIPETYGKKYPSKKFEFVKATVTGVDTKNKTVSLSNGQSPLNYDVLVVATGSKTPAPYYKLNSSWEETESAIRDASKSISAAKNIAVIGGGPTAIETAAEIAEKYGKSADRKSITLFSGKQSPMLETLGKSRSQTIVKRLQKMGVNVAFEFVEILNDHVLVHSDGTEETYDLIILGTGVKPNSGFFPVKDDAGYIPVDSYLRVQGLSNVYAVGDIVAQSPKTIFDLLYGQKKVLHATLKHDLISSSSKLHKYDPEAHKKSIAITLGTQGGVGFTFGVPLPSFAIYYIKGKDFRLSKFVNEWGP